MKHIAIFFSGLVISLFGQLALAQSLDSVSYYQNTSLQNSADTVNLPKVEGVIRRVNTGLNELTIKHEEIPNLGMGAMTMSYPVADPQMLNGLGRGDRVLFSAEEVNGVATVVWIEKQ